MKLTKKTKAKDGKKLQSGVIVDKNTNMAKIIQNFNAIDSFPVLTAKNSLSNQPNLGSVNDKNPIKTTPAGTYVFKPNPDIYNYKGFDINNDKLAKNLAIHQTYPGEFKQRDPLYNKKDPRARDASWGCVNCKKPDIDKLYKYFPQGDTLQVLPRTQQILNKKKSSESILHNNYIPSDYQQGSPAIEVNPNVEDIPYENGGTINTKYMKGQKKKLIVTARNGKKLTNSFSTDDVQSINNSIKENQKGEDYNQKQSNIIKYLNTFTPTDIAINQAKGEDKPQYIRKNPIDEMLPAEKADHEQQTTWKNEAQGLTNKSEDNINTWKSKFKPASELTEKIIEAGDAAMMVQGIGELAYMYKEPAINWLSKYITKNKEIETIPYDVKDFKTQYYNFIKDKEVPSKFEDAYKVQQDFMERLNTPEGKKRAIALDRNPDYNRLIEKQDLYKKGEISQQEWLDYKNPFFGPENASKAKIIEDINGNASYTRPYIIDPYISKKASDPTIALNPNLPKGAISKITRHEMEHGVQGGKPTEIDDMLSGLDLKYEPNSIKAKIEASKFPDKVVTQKDGNGKHIAVTLSHEPGAIDYFRTGSNSQERSPFLAELQQHLLDNEYISHAYATDEITPDLLKRVHDDYNIKYRQGKEHPLRIFNIIKPTKENYKIMSEGLNKMITPIGLGVGVDAVYENNKSNGGWLKKY